MQSKNDYPNCNNASLVRKTFFLIFSGLYVFFGLNQVSAQSLPEFAGKDTLIVYSGIPHLPAQQKLEPSPKYRIKVRSAATANQWRECFAHYTVNIHDAVDDLPLAGTTTSNPSNKLNYQSFTRNWTHTYGNIEMTKNQAVEVEITKINGASVVDIASATVHPKVKGTPAKIINGKVYFMLYNPAQIVVDIDGQMDNFNKGIDDKTGDLSYVAHTISVFANPLIKKPNLVNSRVLRINPQTPRPDPNSLSDPYPNVDTICFDPGIYTNYQNYKVYPNKTYYLPGDAVVYGTFNNIGQTGEARNIKIYGYGTVSGTGIMNPAYVLNANEELYKSLAINNCMNVEVQGVCFADPAFHTVNIDAWAGRADKTKQETFARWVKVISWRGNGDGVGSAHVVEDSFLRTADDATYVKGNRKRCIFWKDFNAAVFNFSSIPDPANFFPIVIEDCDVIYNRSTNTNPLAGVFVQRAAGLPAVQRFVNVTFKDIRITDPRSNLPVFNLFSKDSTRTSRNPDRYSYEYGSSYSGIKFQNISITSNKIDRKQRLTGHNDTDTSGAAAFEPAPWYGGIYFDNVAIDGRKLNINDFNINRFVKDIFFDGSVIIDTPGTSSWVAPEGITSVSVECWGGGGGGGGATSNNYAGGGAGGSYVLNSNVPVVPSTLYTVTVGAGGAASNTGGANGNPGGNTTFGSTIPVTANGGAAGRGVTVAGQLGSGGTNSIGGSGGTLITLGANGLNASASISGAGGNGGGFSGGSGGTRNTGVGAGNSGASPGGGGSGAFGALNGSRQGGAGGDGSVRISYTIGVPNAPLIGTATASGVSGQVTIPFTAPAFNGKSIITSYTATSSPGGIKGNLDQAGSGTITVNGLTNGVVYTFTVTANNFGGQSLASATSNSVTPTNQPTILSNGNGGGAWTSTTTWAGGVVPTANDYVSILGLDVVTVNGTGLCNNLNIATAGSLIINLGSLTVKNTIINNGTITVENNANLIQTAVANTNIGTGTATVKRNSTSLNRLDYTMWSTPVLGLNTLESFSPLTSTWPNRFYEYFEAIDLYRVVPTYSTFDVAKGYLIRMPNSDPLLGYDAGLATLAYRGVFTGVLNNGNIPVTMTKFLNGYTAVGNPYPSVIDADSFIAANSANIESTLYFWRKKNSALGSAYATYTAGGGTTITASSGTPNGKIQVGQGFFVKARKAGTITNFFTNAMRDTAPTSTQFFKTKQLVDKDRIWLNLTNDSEVFSQTLIAYIADATLDVDRYDGKYINDSPVALTSKISNGEYTIQGRPAFNATDVVALNFKTDVTGDYTIALDHFDGLFAKGQGIYLMDSKTGIETDLKAGIYTFNALAGVDNNRFTLKYQKNLKVNVTELNGNNVKVYKNNRNIYVNSSNKSIATIKVYDVRGRMIASEHNIKSKTSSINNLTEIRQVLIIKVIFEDHSVFNTKLIN